MKKWIACGVATAMLITSFAGINFVDNPNKSQAANAGEIVYELNGNGLYGVVACKGEAESNQQSLLIVDKKYSSLGEEFYDEEANEFGDLMKEQMNAYLNGDSGAAVVEEISQEEDPSSYIELGMLSKATFSLYSLRMEVSRDGEDGDTILRYLFQALAEHQNLCPFFTAVNYSYKTVRGKSYLSDFTVYSPLPVSEIKSAVNTYNHCFNRLVQVPLQDTTMTEAEKLLYIHDEIVAMTEYALDDDPTNHIPMAAAVYGKAVCQSYAAIMNQAAEYLGIETLYVNSDTHAWNAVKLDGYWYYIDATWDDPTNRDRDFINHVYFLVQDDDFASDHVLDTEYSGVYGSLVDNMGNAYDNYFPKENYITSQMCYADGTWYYSDNNVLYTWDGESEEGIKFEGIPEDADRECAVFDGKLYYSGSDGVYQYQEEGEDICLSSVPAKGLNMADGILYYLTESGDWTSIQIREPDPTPTPTPTPSPTPTASPTPTPTMEPTMEPTETPTETLTPTPVPTPTEGNGSTLSPAPTVEPTENPGGSQIENEETSVTAPAKPKITVLKNRKTKAMKIKWKKVKGASGYQIKYAANKKLKNSKKKTTKKCKITIKKLKKKKTYYVKVRAYKLVDGEKFYGKWSKAKKVKIKK